MTALVLAGRCPLLEAEQPPSLRSVNVIDLAGVEWVTPFDVAALAVLYGRASKNGSTARVEVPASEEVRRYLVDMGVPSHVPGAWSSSGGSLVEPPLVPLTRLDRSEDWDDCLELLWPQVRGELADAGLTRRLFDVLGELVDNATTHGQSEVGTFVCAQRYTGATSELEPGIWIGIGDGGIGIPHHLRRNDEYSHIDEDEELIRLARQEWVTGTRDRRGWGLVEVFANLSASGIAHLSIWSGQGHGRFRLSPEQQLWARYRPLERSVLGTWVHIRLQPGGGA